VRWLRLWRLIRADLRFLWFALRHPSRPAWLWPVAAVLVLYAIEPANFAVPLIGALDDLLLVPLLLHLLLMLVPGEIRGDFLRRAARR